MPSGIGLSTHSVPPHPEMPVRLVIGGVKASDDRALADDVGIGDVY
jgi:hypothetical protein